MCYCGNCRLPQAGRFELLANFINVNNQQWLQIVEAVHCGKQQPASMHTCWLTTIYRVNLGCHLDSLPACVVDLWWFTRWTLVSILILFLHLLWTCDGLPGEPRLPCWFSSCTCCGPVRHLSTEQNWSHRLRHHRSVYNTITLSLLGSHLSLIGGKIRDGTYVEVRKK